MSDAGASGKTERRSLPTVDDRTHVESVADQLLDMYFDPDAKEMQHIGSYELPPEHGVEHIIEMSRALLFPGYAGPEVHRGARPELRDLTRTRVADLRETLYRQIYRAAQH